MGNHHDPSEYYCPQCKRWSDRPHNHPGPRHAVAIAPAVGVGGSAPRAGDFGPHKSPCGLDGCVVPECQLVPKPEFGRVVDPWTALRAARQQLITLGGDPRKDPHGDAIQGVVLNLIDEALR